MNQIKFIAVYFTTRAACIEHLLTNFYLQTNYQLTLILPGEYFKSSLNDLDRKIRILDDLKIQ